LTEKPEKVTVQIKYKNVEKTFSATLEEAWLLLDNFFNEVIPSFEIANKLWLSVDLQKLAKDCESLIAFSQEGPNLLVPKGKLTDNETLALWLLASYAGHRLGLLKSDAASKEELQAKLGKSGKITSTRLGELVKNDVVAKTADEKFKLTSFGVAQIQKETLPKIRAKTSAKKTLSKF
jgi:DNA-directed RNA polymerase subunit H (RpoH/RPB5)